MEELTRLQKSVLLVLYEYDPIPMQQDEIEAAIIKKGLLAMSEAEFNAYWKNLVEDKEAIKKARLN